MKNIFKFLSLFLIVGIAVSCDSTTGDDMGYDAQTERGWVQFMDGSPAVITAFQGAEGKIELDVNLQVPNTSSDLTINYDLVSVSGGDPNAVFSNTGSVVAPAGQTSFMGPANITGKEYTFLSLIELDLTDLAGATINEPMVFDVVLTGTSSSQITAGLAGETFKVAQRIVINPSLSNLNGVYSVDENFTDGVNAPFGLTDFFGESYQVELMVVEGDASASTMTATNSEGFDTYFIPGVVIDFSASPLSFDDGYTPALPVVALFVEMSIATSTVDFGNGVIRCDGEAGPYGPYQFTLTKQ
jgi:hypothetical protein